ncbi:MAG TPA: glycosyltransferase family 1 protein, partial [Chloroflexota bacterium]|nr:glycosyltransferase family 1 protein [Chloroflexota bacterium]
MLIAIDASSALVRTPSGVGRYTGQLIAGLKRLQAEDSGSRLVFLSNRYDVATAENVSGLLPQDVYARDRLPSRLLWTQAGIPLSLRRMVPDVCHFPNHLAPVIRGADTRVVVTMHDMSVYRCPQYHTRKTVAVHRAIMPLLARTDCLIIAPSNSAAEDIVDCLHVSPERVWTVYAGVAAQYGPDVPSDDSDAAVLARYGLNRPYVLSVGTLEPRKNHLRLIEAFTELVRQERLPHSLVIAGTRGWKDRPLIERTRELRQGDQVRLLGYVRSADLPALYRRADM